MKQLAEKLFDFAYSTGLRLVIALVMVVAGFYVAKWVVRLLQKGHLLQHLDPSVQSFLISFVGIALKVMILITAAAYLGVPMTTMIALLGSAGLAVGLALQGGLSNLAGGLIILVFKPFSVGDYITVGEDTGTVQSIGMFYTVLLNDSHVRVVYPNSELTGHKVTNYSTEAYRRVEFPYSVAYDSDLTAVREALLRAARENPYVLKEPEPFVYMNAHGDSALQYQLMVFVKIENYWPLVFSLNEEVKRSLDAAGVTIPFPQLDVHMPKEKEGSQNG